MRLVFYTEQNSDRSILVSNNHEWVITNLIEFIKKKYNKFPLFTGLTNKEILKDKSMKNRVFITKNFTACYKNEIIKTKGILFRKKEYKYEIEKLGKFHIGDEDKKSTNEEIMNNFKRNFENLVINKVYFNKNGTSVIEYLFTNYPTINEFNDHVDKNMPNYKNIELLKRFAEKIYQLKNE